jgi:hypothetical protein
MSFQYIKFCDRCDGSNIWEGIKFMTNAVGFQQMMWVR